jgi:hypothetical protein
VQVALVDEAALGHRSRGYGGPDRPQEDAR